MSKNYLTAETKFYYELLIPAYEIKNADGRRSSELTAEVSWLASLFYELCASFEMFEEEKNLFAGLLERGLQESGEDYFERWGGRDSGKTADEIHAIYLAAEREKKRERWSAGDKPSELINARPFIAARSFIYALDNVDDHLGKITAAKVVKLRDKFKSVFPHLREVRNSLHHMADRFRGLNSRGKNIVVQAYDDGFVKIPDRHMVLSLLNDQRFGCTKGDGTYGFVDITQMSVEQVQNIVQEVIDSFDWEGKPSRHLPS